MFPGFDHATSDVKDTSGIQILRVYILDILDVIPMNFSSLKSRPFRSCESDPVLG